jgi:hypothetical protein
LLSFLSGSVRYLAATYGPEVWARRDIGELIELAACGKFAGHHLHWETAELTRLLIERGMVVDCIYDRDGRLVEDVAGYDLIIDEWTTLRRWRDANPRARTWFYGTTAHWLYWNQAELERLNWFYRRRGVSMSPSRQLPRLDGCEFADVATFTGSEFIRQTYGPFAGRLDHMYCASTVACADPPQREWSKARKRFLYFGSAGWVHRGLDLVLEAFMRSGLELTVICPDRDFEAVYGHDLQQHPNIRIAGFSTPVSAEFRRLAADSVAVVYASAAEGRSMSVVQCMQFGLIPVVTRSVGLGLHDWLPPIVGGTDAEMIQSVVDCTLAVAASDEANLCDQSHACWEYAQEFHSKASYRACMGTALNRLLG